MLTDIKVDEEYYIKAPGFRSKGAYLVKKIYQNDNGDTLYEVKHAADGHNRIVTVDKFDRPKNPPKKHMVISEPIEKIRDFLEVEVWSHRIIYWPLEKRRGRPRKNVE